VNKMNPRLNGLAYLFLGIGTDVLICLYYRAISSQIYWLAFLMSVLVTIVPFLVAERGIMNKCRSIFFWYALGAGIGTMFGMMIKL